MAETRTRRGANAVEFALVAPMLIALVLVTMDYGWFFFHEWFAMNAVGDAMRWGAVQRPTEDDARGCSACVEATASRAVKLLSDHGITAARYEVTPTVVRIEGTCALSLRTDLRHTPLFGLVPVPERYTFDLVWMLQEVTEC